MVPIGEKWYQKLLVFSLALGVIGAFSALAFTFVTDVGIDFFFGSAGTGWWSGQWWWIPLTAFGGFLVGLMRISWKIPDNVSGGVGLINNAWVEPSSVKKLVTITVVSAIFGASLGPSYGFILLGGGLGSWLVTKLKYKNKDIKQEYMLTGAAGALGASFSGPLLAALMTSEMSPIKKVNYVRAFIPQIIAATVGGVIFFSISGAMLMGTFDLPAFEYKNSQILVAAALGLVASVVVVLFVGISKLTGKVVRKMSDPRVRGAVGGAFVGLIVFALPLAAGSGVGQLSSVIDSPASYGIIFLVFVLLAKMVAVAISLESGFLGGNVFPIMFIGGVTGVIIHTMFPEIPLSLAVATMLAAVPGTLLKAPVTLIVLAVGTVGILASSAIPLAIAYVVAHVSTAAVGALIASRKSVSIK